MSVNQRGSLGFVAIQFPILNEKYLYQGTLGNDITTEQGYAAMEICALNVLSQIENKIGFKNVLGLNHIDAHYVSAGSWDEAPKVVNGASDLFVEALEEKGFHSRSIYGVHNLPRNFCVGLTASFTLKG